MAWAVEISATAERQITRLDPPNRARVTRFLRDRVAEKTNPRDTGQALKGEMTGLWRYRIGDYRLICQIQDELVTVLVLEVGHRREVYRWTQCGGRDPSLWIDPACKSMVGVAEQRVRAAPGNGHQAGEVRFTVR